MIVLTLL